MEGDGMSSHMSHLINVHRMGGLSGVYSGAGGESYNSCYEDVRQRPLIGQILIYSGNKYVYDGLRLWLRDGVFL